MRPATTQEQHPWKASARTAFQSVVGVAVVLPLVLDDIASAASRYAAVVAVATGVSRVMAIPQVEVFLENHVPWLAARRKNARTLR